MAKTFIVPLSASQYPPQTQSSLKNMRQTSLVLFSKIMTEDQNQVNIKDNWKVVDYQMKNINFIKELKKKSSNAKFRVHHIWSPLE